MEVIIISGGLGNQMFQYAFFLAKKKYSSPHSRIVINDFSARREHNGYELDRLFGIPATSGFFLQNCVRLVRKLRIFKEKQGFHAICSLMLFLVQLFGIKIIEEDSEIDKLAPKKGICLYFGLWQTEKYLLSVKAGILNVFSFNPLAISPKTSAILDLIENTNSVSIHVRRGDYLSAKYQKMYENICAPDYYDAAILKITALVESPVFFVFSDDIEWVKENLHIPNPNYIDWNQGKEAWQDMFLMSKCKHNIIANSTFSWWGAWLNQSINQSINIISPKRFHHGYQSPDFIPEGWITI
ncbi:hypothetical protein SAMD00024442_79_5 [Candidatus Symbiothrix dinenymphae]|nr:hypothetical protein SAMD00024442_79_5 [Candidatus Symbiothrix dinenymphae]